MTEPMKRRSLLQDLESPSTPAPSAAITEAAARNGFVHSEPLTGEGARAAEMRRHRPPIGRVHQFNVRLRQDTLEAIYAQANGRNIPIAQVIEEAMDALASTGRR